MSTSKQSPSRHQQKIMHSLPQELTIHPPTPDLLPPFSRLTKTLLPINYPPKFFQDLLIQPCSLENNFSICRLALWNTIPPIPPTGDDDDDNHDDRGSSSSSNGNSNPQVVGGISGRIQPFLHPCSLESSSGSGSGSGSGTDSSGRCEGQVQGPTKAGGEGEYQLYISTLAVLAPWRGQGVAAALLREIVLAAVESFGEGRELGTGRLVSVYAHVWETNDGALDWYRGQGFEVGNVIKGYYRKLKPDGGRIVRRSVVGLVVDGKIRYGNDGGGEEEKSAE